MEAFHLFPKTKKVAGSFQEQSSSALLRQHSLTKIMMPTQRKCITQHCCCIVAFCSIDIPCNFIVSMHCVVLIDLIHVFFVIFVIWEWLCRGLWPCQSTPCDLESCWGTVTRFTKYERGGLWTAIKPPNFPNSCVQGDYVSDRTRHFWTRRAAVRATELPQGQIADSRVLSPALYADSLVLNKLQYSRIQSFLQSRHPSIN